MSKKNALALAAAVSTLICMLASPVGAGGLTSGEILDADGRQPDLVARSIPTDISTPSGPAMGLPERGLLASCSGGGSHRYIKRTKSRARAQESAEERAWDRELDRRLAKIRAKERRNARAEKNPENRYEKTPGEPAPPRSQVMSDQAALRELGYYKGELNGLMDDRTRKAIWNFQRKNGLPIRFTLDPESRRLINSGNAKKNPDHGVQRRAAGPRSSVSKNVLVDGGGTNRPESGGKTRSTPSSECGPCKRKNRTGQRLLADLGYYDDVVDGVVGGKTRKAIGEFKRDNDLGESDAKFDPHLLAALRKTRDRERLIQRVDDNDVSLIMASRHKAGYRLRTADGEYTCDADGAGKVLHIIDRALNQGAGRKIYVDVSDLSPKGVRSFKDTLLLQPKSSVQLIENPNVRTMVFSHSIRVTSASPPTRQKSGFWKSTVAFTSAGAGRFFGDFAGRTKKLTTRVVDWLRRTFSGSRTTTSTLAGSLHQMRKTLIKSGDIKNEEDLRTQLRDQFNETIEIMSLPTGETVRVAWGPSHPCPEGAP